MAFSRNPNMRWIAGLASLVAVSAVTHPANAYCRTTTCDPTKPSTDPTGCQYDLTGCATNGVPLSWPQACVSFSIQRAASPLRHISFDTMRSVVKGAYLEWEQVDCGGGRAPSIQVFDLSPVNCDQVEYNRQSNQLNANIWMFRDTSWPHDGARTTIALTTVTFGAETGQIYDADVEINSANFVITYGDTNIQADLQSIVQHESGHTLGLAESPERSATMFGSYSPSDTSKRVLSADDIGGVCVVYPPAQDRGACDPTPRHGFSTECHATKKSGGCAVEGPIRSSVLGAGGLALGAMALLRLRRRRRASDGATARRGGA
jgi:hypothetical protein